MKRTRTLMALVVLVPALTWTVAGEEASWSITANIAETCNCNPACPCVFGSKSTNEHCEGSRLVEIVKGEFNGVKLDGIAVVIAFRLGAYVEYFVDDEASDEQVEAAAGLMNHAFASMARWGHLSTEKVPISIERSATRLKYTTPESVADLEVMAGREGRPVKVHDLPADFLRDYTQYVAKENSHKDAEHDFKHSGTNGFTSKLKAKS